MARRFGRVWLGVGAVGVLIGCGVLSSVEGPTAAHAAGPSKTELQSATTALMSSLSPGAKADLGTVYYDVSAGSQLVVNFARNASSHASEVKGKFRYPAMVRVGTVQLSSDDLNARVVQATGYLKAHPDIQWSEVYRDDPGDDVIIDTTGDPAALQQRISNDLNATGFVVHHVNSAPTPAAGLLECDSSCSPSRNLESPTQTSAPPVIGGLEISRPDTQAGYFIQCTSAFYATRGSTPYLLTAGHCDIYMNKSAGYIWTVGCCPGNYYLGTMQVSRFQTGFQDDAGIINLPAAGTKDEVWCDGGYNCYPTYGDVNDFWVSRVGQFLDGDDIAGAQICNVGYHSSSEYGNYCGTLQTNNATINYGASDGYPAVTLTNARIADDTCDFGFSGGAVYANGDINSPPDAIHYTSPLGASESYYDSQYPIHALGITSGKDGNGFLIYTHIQYAEQDLGVTVQTG